MSKSLAFRLAVAAVLLALLGSLGGAAAQEQPAVEGGAPMLVSYQGQVLVGGNPFTGNGYFKFAVVNLAGDTSYWSNDGTSGGLDLEPSASVALTVGDGLFSLLLGDTTLAGMTHPLEAGDFAGTERALRVWFSSDGVSFARLIPDRRIAAAPYALQAQEAASAAVASDADTLDGLHAAEIVAGSVWTLEGNAGTDPAADFLGTTDAQPLVLRTNNAERLRLDANGLLGVGTAAPTERLTVRGNTRVLGDDNPVLRGTAVVAGTGTKAVVVAGHRAYVTSHGGNVLAIYDVSDPGSLLPLGSTGTNLSAPDAVAVAGRYAYVVSHDNHRLVIFDVSDPKNILPRGYTSTNLSYPDWLAVAGRYAYVVSDTGLSIFDVSDPDNIVARGTTNAGLSYPNSVAVAGCYAYVTSESNDTLAIFDVSDPGSIVAKGTTTANLDWPTSVAVAGRYAYVTSFWNSALAVFDVSDPSSIVPRGVTTTNLNRPRSVAVAGGPGSTYAYVASDIGRQLAVFDVSDPGAIVAKGTAATSDGPMSVAVAGRYAYVVQYDTVLALFGLNHLEAPTASIGSLRAGGLQVGESAVVGDGLSVLGSLSVGQGALFGGPVTAESLSVKGSTVWHAGNDGAGSALDADLLDGSHAAAFSLSGHNHDAAYVNEAQADSITSSMILNGTLAFADIGQNGCSSGQVLEWNGTAWTCGTDAGTTDHGALTGLLDDDHTQYFALSQNETVAGIPAFNGGTSGTSAPFSVDSNTLVTNLNADLLDGSHASAFAASAHTHATLTAGTGLGGGSYNGGSAATFSVSYGTAAGTAVQGNQAATISAGNGLTGGVSADALGDGFTATLGVGGGNGISTAADALNLGPFTADWSQTGAFDLVLNNASSELRVLESAGATYFGTFDVGDLAADQTYTFGTGGTVWTSGNDGTGSTLDADLLDGSHASAFAASAHTHASLTPGTGLSGTAYNGGAPVSNWAVVYGTAASTAVQGNQAATISAGNGLTGGVSADALGDGFTATLNVVGGNGITAAVDALNLGPFTADWSQTGAFDLVLNNAASELQILESAGATYFGAFDVGDLGANQTYTFGTGGTVWTSGNDGAGSTLDADLLDGNDSAYFSPATHTHDTTYWKQDGNSFGAVGRLGTNDNYPLELEVASNRILRLERPNSTSPNLIGGQADNNATAGVYGAVIGGGGMPGNANEVQDNFGFIGGGFFNRVGDDGDGNLTDDTNATVVGGAYNTAGGAAASIGGGLWNVASGVYATVPGGSYNTAAGQYSFAAGRRAKAIADGCFVWGDSTNADVTCNTANQFVARASGGVSFTGSNSFTINGNTAWHAGNDGSGSGLDADTVDGTHGSALFAQGGNVFGATAVLGTNDNRALELEVNSTTAFRITPTSTSPNLVGGGSTNSAYSGVYGGVIDGGGESGSSNTLFDHYGVVGGGRNNYAGSLDADVANATFATIGGGAANRAGATYSTVGGGFTNTASGSYTTVPGGQQAAATHYGEMAYASGAFATPGDAQTSTYVLRNTSVGTTITPLYLDGSASLITLAAGRSMAFDILIVAMADNGQAASYQYAGGILRLSTGQTGLIGPVQQLMTLEQDPNWEVHFDADPVNNALRLEVRGVAGRTIHWVATVRAVETAMP